MNRDFQSGSIIITLLIIISLLCAIGALVFHSTALNARFTAQRTTSKKQFLLAYSLLEYTIELAKDNYEILCKKDFYNQLEIPLQNYNGIIDFKEENAQIMLTVTLLDKKKAVSILSCMLSKNVHNEFYIHGFKR